MKVSKMFGVCQGDVKDSVGVNPKNAVCRLMDKDNYIPFYIIRKGGGKEGW